MFKIRNSGLLPSGGGRNGESPEVLAESARVVRKLY